MGDDKWGLVQDPIGLDDDVSSKLKFKFYRGESALDGFIICQNASCVSLLLKIKRNFKENIHENVYKQDEKSDEFFKVLVCYLLNIELYISGF